MSKERLEEFKEKIDFLDDSADMDDFGRFVDTLQNMYEDGEFHWIVRYTKEQAERMQELESEVTFLTDYNHALRYTVEQNKRYREALEKLVNAPLSMSRGRYADYADMIAREALEGESE